MTKIVGADVRSACREAGNALAAELERVCSTGATAKVVIECDVRDGEVRPHYRLGDQRTKQLRQRAAGRAQGAQEGL